MQTFAGATMFLDCGSICSHYYGNPVLQIFINIARPIYLS